MAVQTDESAEALLKPVEAATPTPVPAPAPVAGAMTNNAAPATRHAILPICAGPDARRFAKGPGWGALAALLSGFGMTVAFVETWRQGMANLASIGQIPGIVLDGQQFQYAGGLGAAIAAIPTSAFGVQLELWRGFQSSFSFSVPVPPLFPISVLTPALALLALFLANSGRMRRV
ncbi:hypothetical protein DFJ74DRAFT_701838 [Hyaloraphidium curvatum]|nr:hypothetical protein DFJ74DRAFT_701838 [Hyaloraphidium curvatum]